MLAPFRVITALLDISRVVVSQHVLHAKLDHGVRAAQHHASIVHLELILSKWKQHQSMLASSVVMASTLVKVPHYAKAVSLELTVIKLQHHVQTALKVHTQQSLMLLTHLLV